MDRRLFLAAAPAALLLPRPADAADTLSVLLDWFINPNHAPLVVAGEMGAFSRRGLTVDLVQPADPTMPPRLVAAGHGDIAVSYQTLLYRQVLGGLPILRIGAAAGSLPGVALPSQKQRNDLARRPQGQAPWL